MIHIIASFWGHDIWHPLSGLGYQFWSGIGSDFSEIAIIGGAITLLKHHNCHVPGCLRLGKHVLNGTPYKVCRKHHPDVPNNVSLEHIHKVYWDQKKKTSGE